MKSPLHPALLSETNVRLIGHSERREFRIEISTVHLLTSELLALGLMLHVKVHRPPLESPTISPDRIWVAKWRLHSKRKKNKSSKLRLFAISPKGPNTRATIFTRLYTANSMPFLDSGRESKKVSQIAGPLPFSRGDRDSTSLSRSSSQCVLPRVEVAQ